MNSNSIAFNTFTSLNLHLPLLPHANPHTRGDSTGFFSVVREADQVLTQETSTLARLKLNTKEHPPPAERGKFAGFC